MIASWAHSRQSIFNYFPSTVFFGCIVGVCVCGRGGGGVCASLCLGSGGSGWGPAMLESAARSSKGASINSVT